MSWRDKEMLRREVMPYPAADAPSKTPFVPDAGERQPDQPLTYKEEWSTQRKAVQPAVLFGNMTASWPVTADPIDEDDAGTYYTDWVDLDGGPAATGLFSCPEVAITLTPSGSEISATVYLELYDEDGDTTSVLVAVLTCDGAATRTGSGDALFSLTSGKLITKVRYRVVAEGKVYCTLVGSSLTSYGSA